MPGPRPTTTPDPRSIGGRWRTAVAFSLSLTLGFAGASAASAATDPPAPDGAPATSATERVVEFPMSPLWTDHTWSYGDNPRNGTPYPVAIGRDTRTLILDVDIEPRGPVVCAFGHSEDDGPAATTRWTAEQWSSAAPKSFAVPEVHGDYLRCNSGAADQPNWLIEWSLYIQREDVGPVAVLADDEKHLTVSRAVHHYNSPDLPRPVFPGDIVRISGAPGTWPQDDDVRVWLVNDPTIALWPDVSIGDAVVSADGSTVQFRMADEPSPGFFGPKAIFHVRAASFAEGPPRHWENTSFRAPLVYAVEPPPAPNEPDATVAVTLSGRYALWFQRRTATAVVKTTDIPTPAGTVSFAVNGKPVGTMPLGANGKAAFRLPALDRGRYSVTATFTPAAGTPSAVSRGAWLRVLL